MEKQGRELEIISQIDRDGKGTSKVSESYLKLMQDETFSLRTLSLTQGTFIAFNFNAFVVKLKK